ncbi:MAG: hypothetical protein Q8R16_04815 [bacterium]|nr:hypothetical protein [bacterium]
MAAEIIATIRPDGTIEVALELPPGAPCDAADDTIRAVLALLGAGFEETKDDAPRRDPVPNGMPERVKTGGGS